MSELFSTKTSMRTIESLVTKAKHAFSSLDLIRRTQDIAASYAEPPSPCKAAVLRKELQEAQLELTSLAQSNSLRTATRRAGLQELISSHRALLSPWRYTPAELLEIIFSFVKEDDAFDLVPRLPKVAQVCQRWRDIALGCPALWCDISVDFDRLSTSSKTLKLVQCILERSRQHPLRICFRATNPENVANKTFGLLLDHAPRWSHAILTLNASTIFSCLRPQITLNALHTLELERVDGGIIIGPGASLFDLVGNPALRHVYLKGNQLQWDHADVVLPWHQLLTYSGANVYGSPFHPLQDLTAVTTLNILWNNATEYSMGSYLTMPNVERLHVHFPDPDLLVYMSFFNHIMLPNLKQLKVDTNLDTAPSPLPFITVMISNSTTPSTSLLEDLACLAPRSLDVGLFTKLLRLVPNLKILHIPLPPLNDLQQLMLQANRRPLVPKLHTNGYQK